MSPEPQADAGIVESPFGTALSDRYLVYALSTITARSLPDVRDGLKPVHRRLLWAMRLLRLDPASAYKKCARVVGDVIGKYHPHGDQSVYDALVRLAQDFSLRYPLVDGQGNFGNVDGDNAAAMRYTEARLTRAATLLMEGVDEETVGFRPTYNGEEEEPEVFPAAFPNLLANGASGIAVGMATSIPPHNVAEIAAAATLLLNDPATILEEILAVMPGPDFPTGGIIVESPESLREAYATGRGPVRLRARWQVEEQGRGTWAIVVHEIPWGLPKARLIEQIAGLIADRKLPILEDVRDESDTEIRLVLVPRARTVEPDMLMESLFRMSDLEMRISINLNVLLPDRTPQVLGLKALLQAWLDHRQDVLVKASRHRLAAIADRLELLAGYLIVYLNIDEVIRIIREEDDPKAELIARYGLTDRQAEAILNMRLRSLRRLEEIAIRQEQEKLSAEQAKLDALVASPARQRTALKAELNSLAKIYAPDTALGRRRTGFAAAPAVTPLSAEAMIEREPLTVIISAKNWVRAMKGHTEAAAIDNLKFKEGDGPGCAFHAETVDKLLLAASGGRFFMLSANDLPGGRGFGEPLSLMVDFPAGDTLVTALPYRPGQRWLLAASDGRGFIANSDDLLAETRKGRQVMNLKPEQTLVAAIPVPAEHDHVAVIGENRKLLIFPLETLPMMTRGQGVALQKYRDGSLSDIMTLKLADGLSWKLGGESARTRTETDLTPWLGNRAGSGRLPPQGFPKDNKLPR
ncbi:MAG: DNA topoisomerase IV subunit A [Sphingomonadaceae bacterium]